MTRNACPDTTSRGYIDLQVGDIWWERYGVPHLMLDIERVFWKGLPGGGLLAGTIFASPCPYASTPPLVVWASRVI